VSIRAINRAAGLGPASVHYHFGTKEALVEAVLSRFGEEVSEGIAKSARASAASPKPPSARDLVVMLAEPYAQVLAKTGAQGIQWVRVIGQVNQLEPDRINDRSTERLLTAAAKRAYPEASPRNVRRALRMVFQLLVSQLAHAKESTATTRARQHRALADFDLLIDFLAGGLDSALSQPTVDSNPALRQVPGP
jgi:AcrR family transcriptional regulator